MGTFTQKLDRLNVLFSPRQIATLKMFVISFSFIVQIPDEDWGDRRPDLLSDNSLTQEHCQSMRYDH